MKTIVLIFCLLSQETIRRWARINSIAASCKANPTLVLAAVLTIFAVAAAAGLHKKNSEPIVTAAFLAAAVAAIALQGFQPVAWS